MNKDITPKNIQRIISSYDITQDASKEIYSLICNYIKNWKGEINTEVGNLLHNKLNELKKK